MELSSLTKTVPPLAQGLRQHENKNPIESLSHDIKSTDLDLRIVYVPGLSNRRNISLVATHVDFHNSSW